jgi:hypothetical protein
MAQDLPAPTANVEDPHPRRDLGHLEGLPEAARKLLSFAGDELLITLTGTQEIFFIIKLWMNRLLAVFVTQ